MGDYRDWKWDFGDGAKSSEKHGEHTYKASGEYTVTLTAMGPGGKQQEMSKKLAVASSIVPPDAHFVLPMETIEVGKTLRIVNNSTGTIRKTVWDMGDGTKIEKEIAEHRYAKPGEYTITLTVSNELASDSESATLVVDDGYKEPVIDFRVSEPSEGVVPFTVKIDNRSKGSIKSYRWDFGDGKTSDDREPSHTYHTPGTYVISLTIVDQKNHEFTASESQRATVKALSPPPPPRYPAWVPWVAAIGSYVVAWLLVLTGLWRWNRRSIHYQEDGRPGWFRSWKKDFAHPEFGIVMRRTLLLRKVYRYQEKDAGASASSLRGPLYDGDRIRAGCWVTTSDGKKLAVGKLNDTAWKCLVPHGIALILAASVLAVLSWYRFP